MRIWSQNRAILGWLKFVSRYVERDKKNVEEFDFCSQTIAQMIENHSSLFIVSSSEDVFEIGV